MDRGLGGAFWGGGSVSLLLLGAGGGRGGFRTYFSVFLGRRGDLVGGPEGSFSTHTQLLRLDIVRLPPEETRSWHRFGLFVPVGHVGSTGYGPGVDDGHGVGGDEFETAVMGLAEWRGKLRGMVEPEDPDEDLAGGFMAADFEDVGGPGGELGEIGAGDNYDVVHAVGLVVDWMDVGGGSVRGRERRGLVRTDKLFEAL